jgi:HAE1 family hydrophobic/amphiphilic exporter-1
MPLAKLAIKQPLFITMVLLAVTLVGVLSYLHMGVDLLPDMSNPTISVSVSYPGASPQNVETQVTKVVEQALNGISGVSNISSTSSQGMSMVTVSFVVGFNLEQAAEEVREAIDPLIRSLPSGAQTPVMRRFDQNAAPFMTVALTIKGTPLSSADMNQLMTSVIQPRLQQLAGVASVGANGLSTPEVAIKLDAIRLTDLQVSPQQITTALVQNNSVLPAGQVKTNNQNLSLNTAAQFQNIDEIGNLIVARHGLNAIQISQVATVAITTPPVTSYTRLNGQNTILISVQKQSGSNVVQTAALVRDEFKSLSHDFPNLSFNIVQDDSTFIQQSVRDVLWTLIIGALLAGGVLFLFFRNMRNVLITIAGLPIIVIATFAIIHYLGYTLNIISLMALSLSVGLLIDDAIVVRENIFRHMEYGESPKDASQKATGEIAFAVLAITLSIVAVFIPVGFTSGQIGNLFKQFGITIAAAVLISLFEAFTFAPLLTAHFAKPIFFKPTEFSRTEKGGKSKLHWNERFGTVWESTITWYKKILAWSLNHRRYVLGGALVVFAITVWIVTTLPLGYFPTSDPHQVNIGISLPTGTPLEKTDQVARDVENILLSQSEVQRIFSRVGGGSSSQSGSISVQLKGDVNTDNMILRLRSLLSQYRGNITYSKPNQFLGIGFGLGGGTSVRGRPVVITVQGPGGIDALNDIANQIVQRLNTVRGLKDTATSTPPQTPVLNIVVDRQRAANAGINAATLGQTVSTLFQDTVVTQVDWSGYQRMNVTLQLRDQDISDTSILQNLPIISSSGDVYPLSALTQVQQSTGPTTLSRYNGLSQISVGSNLEGRTAADVMPDVRKALSGMSLPVGVMWTLGGQQQQTASAFSSLTFAMILGLIFVYMVLASQFGSLIHPLTVMTALPLAAIGAVFALLITHTQLTVISMIGMLLLMGIATKNSILLVDFIIRYRREGQARTEAVLAAGPVRIRPILMTSLSIILGMIPTALGIGAAGTFRAPMAIAVIGGVFTSTLLSLVVVPVAYTVMDDIVVAVPRLIRGEIKINIRRRMAAPEILEAPPLVASEDDPPPPIQHRSDPKNLSESGE